jgi:hypothetical protein
MRACCFVSFNRPKRLHLLFRVHGGHVHASLSLHNGNDSAPATRATQRITYVGGAVNLGMAVGTAAVGLASGSSSLMAHAVSQLCL